MLVGSLRHLSCEKLIKNNGSSIDVGAGIGLTLVNFRSGIARSAVDQAVVILVRGCHGETEVTKLGLGMMWVHQNVGRLDVAVKDVVLVGVVETAASFHHNASGLGGIDLLPVG